MGEFGGERPSPTEGKISEAWKGKGTVLSEPIRPRKRGRNKRKGNRGGEL